MIRRHQTSVIDASLDDFPIVLLIGARQVGKTTAARRLVEDGIMSTYLTLDDLMISDAARRDPKRFVEGLRHGTVIDEIQRVPELLVAIKYVVDKNRAPGRFLLTGSANILGRRDVTESLAGRMDVIRLDGLSVAEAHERPPSTLLDELFSTDDIATLSKKIGRRLDDVSPLIAGRLREAIFFGGFPDVALRKSTRFATRWFRAYFDAYVERDVRDLANLRDTTAVGRLARIMAVQTSSVANFAKLASDVEVDKRTVARYVELLEETFQIRRLRPWFRNVKKRLVKRPRHYAQDSGMACTQIGIRSPDELIDHDAFGTLLETWAVAEFFKLAENDGDVNVSFYRTHSGREVDVVLERHGKLRAIEIRAARTIRDRDVAGLHDFQDTTSNASLGFVLHPGDEVLPLSPTCTALPISAFL